MHNYFLLHPTELRQEWRKLRKQLATDVDDTVHYQNVIDWWSSAPLSKRYLDYTTCKEWPDPWDIIDRKEFDTNSIALCMFYTLLFADNSKWSPDRLALAVIVNRKHSTEQLVCVVDNMWLLGYCHSKLTNFASESDLECRLTYNYDSRLRQIEETVLCTTNQTATQPTAL